MSTYNISSVCVYDFKKRELKKLIFKNEAKRFVKSQVSH
jgi:hypothetical protein